MANNKESMVIVVDVGVGGEDLTKKASECTLQVIKHKIFNHKVDMLSVLLFRTDQTENVGNSEEPDQYLNICQVLPGSQVATWYMAKEFLRALEKPKSKNGDWVDTLIVAIGIITEDTALHKAKNTKIVLFHDFDSPLSCLDDDIVAKLNELDFKLVIVSNNVHYIPDSDGNLIPRFKSIVGKDPSQTKNEELALQLLKAYPYTTLCNFNDALPLILRKELTRPWTWNATLAIGSRIVIQVSGVIAIKQEDCPKFQKKAKSSIDDANIQVISREKKYFSGVDELPEQTIQDRITGYMLGDTPMPYDPSLGQAAHVDTKKGVYFIGFVPAENIPQEHFSGESTYVLLPQKGKRVSAKMMDSLVRVISNANMSILAWKVYNNGNKPKLVVLLPNLEHEMAGLSMIELCYHSQYRFWDFPKLNTKKNQPTEEQLAAVDELMAAMDLSPKKFPDEEQKPSDSLVQDHLPFEFLPNIRQQHLIDYVAGAVLKCNLPADDFMRVPDAFQPNACVASEKIKSLFPLEQVEIPTKEKLKKLFSPDDGDEEPGVASTSAPTIVDELKLTHVGSVTPAEDFTALVSYIVNRMPAGAERAARFHQFACQIRSVISDLLFKSITKQNEKIEKALVAYRTLTIAANSGYDYNDWMREIRAKVIERKMFDFWEEVIVKQKLGLCMEDDTQVQEDFYNISRETAVATNVDNNMDDDESVEDLFGNM